MNCTPPDTLTVSVPFSIRKRGGRKAIIMPEDAPVPRPRIDNTVVKALGRAFRWKRMLDSGDYATIGDLAAQEMIAPSYLTRVLRLTLLAPDTVEAILSGSCTCELAELMEPFPVEWQDQLAGWR